MDGKEGLQLLPGTKKRLGIKIPGENRFLYIGSAILGAAIVSAFWFNFNNKALESQITNIDEQLFVLERQRDKKAEENIRTIKRQIELTSEFINNHIYTTRAFAKLESLMPDSIQAVAVSYDSSEKILSLSGLATSYTAVAHQVAALLSDDSITDVSVGQMKPKTSGTIEFNVSISYDQDKLLKKVKTEE